ncbi:MAG: DUF1624 domain-containing protein [Proteobacteria bacterium]|nr:DUF1624 domain-containing protein [Pseudomonadota bacterium]
MPQRLARLDAWRGLAIVWMVGFHFAFDLNLYGLLAPPQRFLSDPFWTGQRTAIVTLFMLCAGVSQAVTGQAGRSAGRFWRRWAQIAGCAALVSVGSALMFPETWISFGVLHAMAAMLLIARFALQPLAHRPALLLALSAAVLAAPRVAAHAVFDSRWGNWTGLVTHLPYAEDYVPLAPWLAVFIWGLVLGRWLARTGWLTGWAPAPLAAMGRWPLTIYMVHQPLLLGALTLWMKLRT